MNTYLLGYAPLMTPKRLLKIGDNINEQTKWINSHVKYYFEPDYEVTPWKQMLDDLVTKYHSKITDGADYRLIIYFHNLDYDAQHFFQMVMDKKLNHDVTINRLTYNASLYSVEFNYLGCHFELRDSLKLYNQSLASLGKSVNWQKQTEKATYTWFPLKKSKKLTDEINYFKFDIGVLSAVMTHHFINFNGKAKLTAAAYAEKGLKSDVKSYDKKNGTNKYKAIFEPQIDYVNRTYIRSAYFGGFVYANRFLLNRKLERGLVGDVNSLYPSVMLNRNYPDWQSLRELEEEEFNQLHLNDIETFGIVTVMFSKLKIKSDGIPVIPKKEAFGKSREIYNLSDLEDDRTITVTTLDLYHIKNNYDCEFSFITGLIADKTIIRPFRDFVLKHKAEKENAANKVERQVAKIYLNSSYGKFAQRPIDTTHVLYEKEDGSIGYHEIPDDSESNQPPKNILIAVWVTAFARDVLFKAIDKVKKSPVAELWYCDTDAVHFGYKGKLDPIAQGKEIFNEIGIPYDENEFGKWKPEQHMSYAVYLGSKRYWEQDPVAENNYKIKHPKASPVDIRKAGAIIKGAGIQQLGKDYLIKKGIDYFRYYYDEPLIVPFNASKKVVGGVKIYRSIKKIEPTEYQNKFINLFENTIDNQLN